MQTYSIQLFWVILIIAFSITNNTLGNNLNPALQTAETDSTQRGFRVTNSSNLENLSQSSSASMFELADFYSNSYALIIGVSDYLSSWPDLPGVRKDIRAVEVALARQGFLITFMENPSYLEMRSALDEFVSHFCQDKDNRIVIYYAGHGHTLPQGEFKPDMGYITAIDTPDPQVSQGGFRAKSINMDLMNTYARSIHSKHALFVFDSCFSGSIFSTRSTKSVSGNLTPDIGKPVRHFITSGSADQTVPDEGVFCGLFVDALGGAADLTNDGFVLGSEIEMFLRSEVYKYSQQRQTPQGGKILDPTLDRGDIVFFARPDTTVPLPLPLAAAGNGYFMLSTSTETEVFLDKKKMMVGKGKMIIPAKPNIPHNIEIRDVEHNISSINHLNLRVANNDTTDLGQQEFRYGYLAVAGNIKSKITIDNFTLDGLRRHTGRLYVGEGNHIISIRRDGWIVEDISIFDASMNHFPVELVADSSGAHSFKITVYRDENLNVGFRMKRSE